MPITNPGRPNRFNVTAGRISMKAVVTRGNGGYDMLDYCDVPIPEPGPHEVLIQVLAAGVNNTEINTRLGWYSSSVSGGTEDLGRDSSGMAGAKNSRDGGWNEETPFPFIQGTDCCGRIAAAGREVDPGRVGQRVLVRPCIRTRGWKSLDNICMASDFDGAFAQFVVVPAAEAFGVDCDWTDAELGTIPCAYGTAENMLHRANVTAGDRVLVTGASGGVGSATVQLAKRRGARVAAVASRDKFGALGDLGADRLIARDQNAVELLGEKSVDVVVDNVAGTGFDSMTRVLDRGGRYASSGAIAGPIVAMDMRVFYLKDLMLIGCTAWDRPVFENLIGYIERSEIRPLLARTFPLHDMVSAQQAFLEKRHVGKFVLIPPPPSREQRDTFHLPEAADAKGRVPG